MNKDKLKKANEKFEEQKGKSEEKKLDEKPNQETGKYPKEAFRRNLGCGG